MSKILDYTFAIILTPILWLYLVLTCRGKFTKEYVKYIIQARVYKIYYTSIQPPRKDKGVNSNERTKGIG